MGWWYYDNSKLSYVATYKNEKDATHEANAAAKMGWMPQGVTATDGHINLGRTITGAALTGGLTLLFGGSRSKGKITITYVRTPQWLMEQAAKKEQEELEKARKRGLTKEQKKAEKEEEERRRIQDKAKKWG